MSWQLLVYDHALTLQKTITDGIDEATGLVAAQDIKSCTVQPWGDCIELDFIGRNDRLGIDTYYPVQYLEEGNPVFWGVAEIHPKLDSRGAGPADSNADALEKFVVRGGRVLLDGSLVGPKLYDSDSIDIADQMYDLGVLYGHPFLTWDAANFPATGTNSSLMASPYQKMGAMFDELVKSIGTNNCVWGVDATGSVFVKVL